MDNENEDYEQEQERKHFCRIVNAYKSYKNLMLRKIEDKEKYVKRLPHLHQSLLDTYTRHLEKQKTCILHNSDIIQLIIQDVETMFENVQHELCKLFKMMVSFLNNSQGTDWNPSMKYQAKLLNLSDEECAEVLSSDLEKVQSTLKQIVRDWSVAGAAERSLCYNPIIEQILNLYPSEKFCAKDINILVPGAGLGRLAYELANKGFTCQGNEFSLFMLFCSNFILNRLRGVNSLNVFPWVHSGSNFYKNADQLQSCQFPDVEPSCLPTDSNFSMAAGDFLEIYTEEEAWDSIVTCFFIDCANNIVSFIETIYKILKPGGYWVNLGPLLYHYADLPGEDSIEPTYEVIRHIIKGMNFKFIEEKENCFTSYTHNGECMLNYNYNSIFFVVQKPSS